MASLRGRRIVVTRARDQAEGLVQSLEALGADVIAAPVIRIEPLPDDGALRSALADPSRWRWIVFTSQNAVHVVCDQMRGWGREPAELVAGAAVQLPRGHCRVHPLLERQRLLVGAEGLALAEHHLGGVAEQHPGVGVLAEPLCRLLGRGERRPAILHRPGEMDERHVWLAERRRP